MAAQNLTKSADIETSLRTIDFVSSYQKNWEHLREILGIMQPIRRAPGTKLIQKYAEVELQEGFTAEGEEVPYSHATVKEREWETLTLERFAKAVTIQAINDHGYDAAVDMTDDQFLFELQTNITDRFYNYIKTGTLRSTEKNFQMAAAMAQGRVRNRWKEMHMGITNIAGFCNILDVYEYLGNAQINNVENQFGINYVKNFLGFGTLFLLSENEIPKGTIIATPVENIKLYYVDPGDGDFTRAGFSYVTAPGETNLLGAHVEAKYGTAETVMHVLMGLRLFSEYIDGIAVITFGDTEASDSANLTSIAIGDLALSPSFDPATTSYTATTTADSDKITAKTLYTDAEVVIRNGATEVKNGSKATWASGSNTVTFAVTNDDVTKTYTVAVTKS